MEGDFIGKKSPLSTAGRPNSKSKRLHFHLLLLMINPLTHCFLLHFCRFFLIM